jgi:hypothetical protein
VRALIAGRFGDDLAQMALAACRDLDRIDDMAVLFSACRFRFANPQMTDINPRAHEYQDYRQAIRELCGRFDSKYWQEVDGRAGYPDASSRR